MQFHVFYDVREGKRNFLGIQKVVKVQSISNTFKVFSECRQLDNYIINYDDKSFGGGNKDYSYLISIETDDTKINGCEIGNDLFRIARNLINIMNEVNPKYLNTLFNRIIKTKKDCIFCINKKDNSKSKLEKILKFIFFSFARLFLNNSWLLQMSSTFAGTAKCRDIIKQIK